MKLQLTIRELKNWFFIKSVIKRELSKPGSQWNTLKLRSNWFGRIYTVVSLREEDTGEELMVQNWKAMEMMRPVNDYLSSLDLQELVFPSIERIEGSRSYLVVYSPIIEHLTIGKFIALGLTAIAAIATVVIILL
jgi:hypothetical protein